VRFNPKKFPISLSKNGKTSIEKTHRSQGDHLLNVNTSYAYSLSVEAPDIYILSAEQGFIFLGFLFPIF
jgi:hypothetical protein